MARPQEADLIAALAQADIRVLLMCLVHLTGDTRWLEPPYTPKRDVRLVPDPSAGLPEEVCAEVRSEALRLLRSGRLEPALKDPGDDLMQRMMSVCLGEAVPAEYGQLTREEMGIVPREARWTETPAPDRLEQANVLIVGAGVCALSLGHALGRLGIPYTIVEKNADLGGTWYVNRYPGCGVDTPNHSYSFSFGRRYRWSRYFSRREEVLDYLNKAADEHGLRQHIRFRTRLLSSRWDEASRRWISQVEDDEGTHEIASAFLVSAVGQLNDPIMPEIEGVSRFCGPSFHSALWPEGLGVKDKRVAVIGTGATAMQLVPAIADDVRSVAVYQRSPQWSRPIAGYSDNIGEGAQWLLEHMPFYAEWFRFNMFWRYGDGLLPFLRKDPAWPHPERAVNRINDRHRQELTDFILSELGDRKDLVEKCVPSYPPYGKRILLDNGWYRTLLKPTVELVDTPIRRIVQDGIETEDGQKRRADIIVYSTGFKVTEMAARLNIKGRGGLDLAEAWADENPTAYLGVTVPGFPNFFCMLGPNSGPAHGGSVIFQAECQTRYISALLVEMISRDIAAIDVRQDVHDAYVRKVDSEHEQLIWTHPGMSTYYRNRQGRVFSPSPWRFVDYWAMTHDPDLGDYKTTPAA
ncbi:MAG: flavin-containing monooxygenase [Parvibaculaceae bacterium]